MITYTELRDLIARSGLPAQTIEFYIGCLDRIFWSDRSESEKQYFYSVIINAIDAGQQAQYLNRFDVQLRDTFVATAEDIYGGVKSIVDIVKNPIVWVAIAGVALLALLKK